MTRKTYAAKGLLDFKMAINVGGAILRLAFSGGSMGSNGIISAKYITENEAIQKIIESSPQFHSQRIILFRTENVSSDQKPSDIGKKEDENAAKPAGDSDSQSSGRTSRPRV